MARRQVEIVADFRYEPTPNTPPSRPELELLGEKVDNIVLAYGDCILEGYRLISKGLLTPNYSVTIDGRPL